VRSKRRIFMPEAHAMHPPARHTMPRARHGQALHRYAGLPRSRRAPTMNGHRVVRPAEGRQTISKDARRGSCLVDSASYGL
jgi:hypothetical protein